jgi:hypothetical protein
MFAALLVMTACLGQRDNFERGCAPDSAKSGNQAPMAKEDRAGRAAEAWR